MDCRSRESSQGRAGGPGSGEPHPGAEGPRLGEDAAAPLRQHVVAHDELAANDAVRLGVPRALELAGGIVLPHVGGHVRDDRVEEGLPGGQELLLRDPEALVPASQVDEGLDHGREGLAVERVEGRPEEWIDAPLQLHELDGAVVESLEEHRAASSGDEPSRPCGSHCMPMRVRSTGGLERPGVRGPHR